MRKLFIGAVVAVMSLAITAVAIAVTEQRLTVTYTKNTTATSTGVAFQTSSDDPENPKNGQPDAVRRLDLDLPAGSKVTPSAVKYCTATDDELIQQGTTACPKKSAVGSGKATAKFHRSDLRNVNVVVTAFNHKRGLILHLDPDLSNSFVLRPKWRGKLTNGPVLRTTVPPNCFPPAQNQGGTCRDPNTGAQGEEVILNSFQLNTIARSKGTGRRKKNLITTPRKCKRNWLFKVGYVYASGGERTLRYKQTCKKK